MTFRRNLRNALALPLAAGFFLPMRAEALIPTAGKEPPARTFGFIHYETTGITSYVLVNGREQSVLFAPNSNKAALTAMYKLKPEVFLPNANGRRLRVIGRLLPGVKHTPKGTHLPTSEPYREFRLDGWYLVAPFKREVFKDLGDPTPTTTRHSKLKRSDFEPFPGLEKLDLRTLVRYQPHPTARRTKR